MSDVSIENSKIIDYFLCDMQYTFPPTNIDDISNDSKTESKEDLPSKQPIKFILTKQESPSVSLLQKKTILKSNDSCTDSENSNNGRWSKEEQNRFAEAVLKFGNDWKNIQNHVSSRNITQVRSHAQKFLMKLKESNFLINKGLDQNLSWTKIMNFLNKNLTYDELKEVLFSVEQTGQKKAGNKKYKNLKKIQNQNKKKDNIERKISDENNSKFNNRINEGIDNIHLYENNLLNLDEEEENYNIKHKMIKEEEDEKELQKFIECFNSSQGEITLNSSFEENSKIDDADEDGFNYLNKTINKLNKYF
jgi:SHAQKYF class myb-like DNA-binding protein